MKTGVKGIYSISISPNTSTMGQKGPFKVIDIFTSIQNVRLGEGVRGWCTLFKNVDVSTVLFWSPVD